ncbi:uncharacterized protein CEXT_350131 [Caerostris extrusa]|uniref:SMB domain-containing protein n=1 Tax=Caerostris extrusa TaxID=172846 RepID=A0AAV4P768_CAEEX|nr:uncharacterized protein CEXT_350131 [Caerostris extrusa]
MCGRFERRRFWRGYGGSYGFGHGYDLYVPEVVTNNTVESLLSNCSHSDNCQGNRTDDAVYDYYCNCDDSCTKYDTCCKDSKHRAESGSVTKLDADVKCVFLRDGSDRHVFMVDTCKVKDVYVAQSSRHVNTHIYTHCRNDAEDNDNPFLMIPVTSKVTGTTYKNYFCAVCNEDINMDQLTLWDLTLEGQSNASEVHLMSALRYSTKFKSWVIMKNANIFKSSRVSISLGVPEYLVSTVQFCRKRHRGKMCHRLDRRGYKNRLWFLHGRGVSLQGEKGGSLQKSPLRNMQSHGGQQSSLW